MPTFIDRHPFAAVPRPVRRQMFLEAARGLVDEHGVQPLGYWLTDGAIYCVLRAPSQAAFCRHHTERGLPCDELRPVTGPRGSRPLGAKEAQIVRVVLNRWPVDGAAV